MNIIKFIKFFSDENSGRQHFPQVREHEGIGCKNVAVRSIMGYKPNGRGNVPTVVSELRSAAEQ